MCNFIVYIFKNLFHFAVVCSVFYAQMTSQRGENKKVFHETKSSGHRFLTTLWRPLFIYNWTDNGKMESIILYNKYMKFIHVFIV